jgi:hypothetical protein
MRIIPTRIHRANDNTNLNANENENRSTNESTIENAKARGTNGVEHNSIILSP